MTVAEDRPQPIRRRRNHSPASPMSLFDLVDVLTPAWHERAACRDAGDAMFSRFGERAESAEERAQGHGGLSPSQHARKLAGQPFGEPRFPEYA